MAGFVYRDINSLWHGGTAADWKANLDAYWQFIEPKFRDLEKRMDALKPETIRPLDRAGWFQRLYEEYFVWKYGTHPRRLQITRHGRALSVGRKSRCLSSHYKARPDELLAIKQYILDLDPATVEVSFAIETAKRIDGLGVPGASGLLALLFPSYFGTVDFFLVKTLKEVTGLAEEARVMQMSGKALTTDDAVVLTTIMRRKALENAGKFDDPTWTPRKIDMVLWATREKAKCDQLR